MSERSLTSAATEQLEAAGFFVEHEVGSRRGRHGASAIFADLIGWGGDEDGELVADVVVEIKANLRGRLDLALAQLSRVAAIAGARRAFFFDGRWHEADPTFTRFDDAGCPRPMIAAADARVPRKLIERELWALRAEERGRGVALASDWTEMVARIAEGGPNSPVSRLGRNRRSRLSLARVLSEGAYELEVPPTVVDALVRLLAPWGSISVLDPACRLGGALWAVAEVAPDATFQGCWPNESAGRAARSLGRLCNASVDIACASFEEILARPMAVDAIISVPPFNVRLKERVQLADGSTSSELNVALLDRAAGWLKPGGRAVMVVPPRVLFEHSASALRRRLAAELRVVAVVELPSGIFESTRIPIAIVVLERRPATETLVANLRADWESQLSTSGEFFRAYQTHLAVRH